MASSESTKAATSAVENGKAEQKAFHSHPMGQSTACIHGGQEPDPHTGAVMPPISMSSTFLQHSPGNYYPGGFEYSRSSNPVRNAFERGVASVEGAKHGIAFASGLAATAAVVQLLSPGEEVLSIDDVYGGTGRYFRKIAKPNSGIKVRFLDMSDPAKVGEAFKPETKILWLETPTNPMLKVADIKALSEVAHKHGVLVVVDNTFLSPIFQNPLKLGADIVLHSVSKYINGHSDVVMGALAVNDDDLAAKLRFVQNGMGGIPSPFDSYLTLRGLKTLALRMERSAANAAAAAAFLEKQDKIERVIYPGLASHPQHEIAKRQQSGFGGMISVILKGGLPETRRFMEALEVFSLAESLGGVESLANHPAIMTHASVPAEHRVVLGITDSLVRLSVGIENVEDLLWDLEQALSKV